MRPLIRLLKVALFIFTLPAAVALAFWLGLVPVRFIPFAPLDLTRSDQWFVDLRLAALKLDRSLCTSVLAEPIITASPVPNQPFDKGCGWNNAVSISQTAGAKFQVGTISCPMAGALALWFEHEVQTAAQEVLGARVASVRHMGTYSCRNIVGLKGLKPFRSQHASANAIDIAAFTLTDGRTVSVEKHWKATGVESSFLHRIHQGACRYFRVAVGPDFNAAHFDHFHLDRGAFKSCR